MNGEGFAFFRWHAIVFAGTGAITGCNGNPRKTCRRDWRLRRRACRRY